MNPRALLARACVPVIAPVIALAAVLAAAPAYAEPTAGYEMPFPCGQAWTGTTRASHSPSSKAVDWNRVDDYQDPVVAAAAGTVKVADSVNDSGYGRWVWLDHGNGETTIYAHLDKVVVPQGATVDQGTLLGYLGTTGNSSGPHLHFEERSGSSVIAPWFHRVLFKFGSTLTSANCVDVPLAANMLGDDKAERVVFRREARAKFLIQRPGTTPLVRRLGTSTDQPILGDWDGDGYANPGVRTPSTGTFKMMTPAGLRTTRFGKPEDLPVAGDFDGDGVTDIGVRRGARNVFALKMSKTATVRYIPFGTVDDVPLTGDWNGDKITDLGAYDAATSTFNLRIVDAEGLVWTAAVSFGEVGDLPVVGDWDANGRTDVGVWSPGSATYTLRMAPAPTASQRSITSYVFGRTRR